MRKYAFHTLGLLFLVILAACAGTRKVGIESSPIPALTTAVTPLPTSTVRPSPAPVATATSVASAVPAVTPSAPIEVTCADVTPFAPGCLDQPRPPELAPDVTFTGIVPAGLVTAAAWSPDGDYLAYAVTNPEGFEGLEVRALPDFRLEGRWDTGPLIDLTWTLDGQAVLFVFDRGAARGDVQDTSSIGLAYPGETGWRDLLPGEKARLAVSLGKNFVGWLSKTVLAFRVHCGTACESLYTLDVATGILSPAVNTWGREGREAPYAQVFATFYLFSPDRRWLAATSWGRALPVAQVLEWPGPAEPVDLSANLDGRYTEAQSWGDGVLAFVAYPPGEPDDRSGPPQPDLYVWEADAGAARFVETRIFRATFAPTGDRLAALCVGGPSGARGPIESIGAIPYLVMWDWPERRLTVGYRVSTEEVSDVWDFRDLPTPVWSPQGDTLAFRPAEGGLTLMSRGGEVRPVVTGRQVDWVGWGAGGDLALLVDDQMWLVRTGEVK